MSLHIENKSISVDVDGRLIVTAAFREHAAADGQGAWIASCGPGRLLNRDQAITALTVAELLETDYATYCPLVAALRKEQR